MTTAYDTAMDRLRDEMARNSENLYITAVGEYLTDYLTEHPASAAAINQKDKSIAGSLKAMEAEARKRKRGSVAVLDDRTAFKVVRGYYGIEDEGEGEDEGG